MAPPAPSAVTRHYAAFLSYQHGDNREEGRRWAEWLHQALETYDVPREIVGKPNIHGRTVPASLYPVFRDEEELPADANLSQGIYRALENSDLLIVLCSPRACQSRYIDDEIRYYKELGKSDHIIALILDGEPNADKAGDVTPRITKEMECLPWALRFGRSCRSTSGMIDWTQPADPLAADVRPQNRPGQGYTSAAAYGDALEKTLLCSRAEIRQLRKAFAVKLDSARLKLIAGALGVPLGELTRRDALHRARRFRRLATFFGSLAMVALMAAGVAVWEFGQANRQRVRVIESKKAADDLIEYMQYDLSNTLRTVGRLDMMEGINMRILRYQEEHPAEADDQAAQEIAERERAVALDQQGTIYFARGQHSEALKSFQNSLAIREKLATRAPNIMRRQFDLWDAFTSIADVQAAQNDFGAALNSYQSSLRIARGLNIARPDTFEILRKLATSFQNVCDMQMEQNELRAALESLKELSRIRGILVINKPNDSRLTMDYTLAYERLGNIKVALNDLSGALEHYQESLQMREQLVAADPDNSEWQHNLATNIEDIGRVQARQSNLHASLVSYQRSLVIRKSLASRDPSNANWQRELAICLNAIGGLQLGVNDVDAALDYCQQSLTISLKLVSKQPGDARWNGDLASVFANIGDVKLAQIDATAALEAYRKSEDVFGKLSAASPRNAVWHRNLASCFARISKAQLALRDFSAALASSRQSNAIYEKLAGEDGGNLEWQLGLAYNARDIGLIFIAQRNKDEALIYFRRYLDLIDRLATGNPSDSMLQLQRAGALFAVAGCLYQPTPEGRDQVRPLLQDAADILHKRNISSGLQPGERNLLRLVEAQLAELERR